MSSKQSYRLINPIIEGSVDTVVKAKNSFSAGKKIYNVISGYFTNHVKDFNMTIQNIDTKALSHFNVNEKMSDDSKVDYDLVKLEGELPKDVEKKLLETVDKQMGGRRNRDDSSDSDSSSSDEEYSSMIYVQPITRFIYYNLPYYKFKTIGLSRYDSARLFMPMFSLPVNPIFEIVLDIYS